jgi:hypothetical protein
MKRSKAGLLLLVVLSLVLSSCGGGSSGGGLASFKTVQVSATAATPRLESDVRTGNTCGLAGSTGGTFSTDLVNVTLTSTVYPNYTGTISPVEIDSYVIHFAPADNVSPALPDISGSIIGQTVTGGGTLILPIAVVTDLLKFNLVTAYNLQLCSATMYTYYVTITFNALELNTGTRAGIQTSLTVAIADRN